MNALPTSLHYKTTSKRLKDLMLHSNFDELRIEACCEFTFYVDFPTGEVVVIDAPNGILTSVEYNNEERSERGRLSDKHEIAAKFTFAVWRFLDDRKNFNTTEEKFYKMIYNWARHFGRGYAKTMWTNEEILNA